MRNLLALALLLAPVVADEVRLDDASNALASAREELKFSRAEFRKLVRIERDALKDARATVAATAKGRALAPALCAAADALEGGRGEAKDLADLLSRMAQSYRAMAAELEKEVAPEAIAKAEALLEDAAAEKDADEAKRAWRLVKRGDPRYRALAVNMAALKGALAAVGEQEGAPVVAVAKAAKLHEALEPMFEGVETARPEPPEAACPT